MKFISPILGYSLKTLSIPVQMYAERALPNYTPKESICIKRNRSYGAHRQHKMDIFVPNTKRPLPILVFVHGGAWLAGDKSLYTPNCYAYAEAGYVVFNINYRLAPAHTYHDQMRDLANALLWVEKNAHRYSGDAKQMFIAGDSTGANLVLNYVNAIEQPYLRTSFNISETTPIENIRGLLLIYGTFDLEKGLFGKLPLFKYFQEMLLGSKDLEEQVHLASPLRHLHRYLPPIFITAGEVDPLFDQSALLADKLKQSNSYHQTLFFKRKQYADAYHFFFHFQQRECAKQSLKGSFKFMSHQNQGFGHNVIRFAPFLQLGT